MRSREGAVVVAVMVVTIAAHATESSPKRHWIAVPGHENILVDLASVARMWTSLVGPRDYSTSPPKDLSRIPTETTDVSIKLNGHVFSHYMITCSGFWAGSTEPSTVYFPQGINELPTKVMGYVPAGVVEALACPAARLKQRSTHTSVKL